MEKLSENIPINLSSQIKAEMVQEALFVTEDYSAVLDKYGVSYVETGYYWQVGEITIVQGWILHISVVRSQILELMLKILPVLLSHNLPFKIVKDKGTARTMLDGDFGQSQVGKVICVYPHSTQKCLLVARQLADLTAVHIGPAIPTDAHLGGTVYTRWGSFKPVLISDARGQIGRHIYDDAGNLKPDIYNIPFILPAGKEWPFSSIRNYKPHIDKKILQNKYKLIGVLSYNAKGNVFKAIYRKKLLQTKPCVIKQGLNHMWSDDHGRDIKDRLTLQWQLYRDWSTVIRVPEMIDLFEEEGNTYLAMEEIKGVTLHSYTMSINSKCDIWPDIPQFSRAKILHLMRQLLHIIICIHKKGYVHRDITPVNFLVTKNAELVPIDVELSWSITSRQPSPPFEFGTHGFMSPEQARVETPTIKEDVYGMCATLITMLTGLPPGTFEKMKDNLLYQNLLFFLGDETISRILALGLHPDPNERPSLEEIDKAIEVSGPSLTATVRTESSGDVTAVNERLTRMVIQSAIRGLVTPPMPIHNDLWYSRVSSCDYIPDSQRKEFGKSVGTYEGITGVLYLLGRAKLAGFDIVPCLPAYQKGWKYLREKHCTELSNTVPGLFGGAAGIALALATGIKAGLVEESVANRSLIQATLELDTHALDLAQGVSGQAIVALQCRDFLDEDVLRAFLLKSTKILLSTQQKSGEWVILRDSRGKKWPAGSLSYGNTGILWFLMEYESRYHDALTRQCIAKPLAALCRQALNFKKLLKRQGFRKTLGNPLTSDGIPGTVLALVKAYEVFKESTYRDAAESILDQYPCHLVHENISQDVGLAGLGELYLEADRVFDNPKWKQKADWLVNFFLHTRIEDPAERCYWLNNNASVPTADLMVGTGGVIHFLIRALNQNKVGYRLHN